MTTPAPDPVAPTLGIPQDTVCYIVRKLREYESMDLLTEREEPVAPWESGEIDQLMERENEYAFDPVRQELASFVGDLADDQKVELVALMWLGRNSASMDEWPAIREQAMEAYNARTLDYLLGSPQACDFLQEGLLTLGYSCDAPGEETP